MNLLSIKIKAGVVPYFEELGYPCPSHTNPADHVIGIVNTDFASGTHTPSEPADATTSGKNSTSTAPPATTEALATAWQHHQASQRSTSASAPPKEILNSNTGAHDSENEKDRASVSLTRSPPDRFHPQSMGRRQGKVSSLRTQVWRTGLLMERMALNYTRNLLAYGVRVGMYAGMGFLLATIWVHLGNNDTTINDRLSVSRRDVPQSNVARFVANFELVLGTFLLCCFPWVHECRWYSIILRRAGCIHARVCARMCTKSATGS